MTKSKQVMGEVVIVGQNDPCKYISFVKSGQFQMLREIEFIDQLAYSPSEYIYIDPKHSDPKVVMRLAESLLPF